jgi:hypothetical protein
MASLTAIAAIDSLVLLGIAVFQVLLASGKPWGQYAWGGNNPGVLPKNLRIGSALSVAVYVAVAVVVLIEGDVIIPDWKSGATNVVTWVLTVMLALGVGANAASRSSKERKLWVPISATASVLTFIVAISG